MWAKQPAMLSNLMIIAILNLLVPSIVILTSFNPISCRVCYSHGMTPLRDGITKTQQIEIRA